MGTLTLLNFRTETRVGVLGRQADDTIASNTRVDRWVNASYRYVSQPNVRRHEELRQSQTFALVTNQEAYTLTAGLFYVEEDVYVVENPADVTDLPERLLPIRWREFLDMKTSAGGHPEFYNIRAGTIRVLPFPSAQVNGWSLVVDRWTRPARLTADGDLTVLSDDWDEVILAGAVWFGFKSLGDATRAELAKADFDALINNQLDVERVRAEDRTEQLVTVEPGDYEEGLP